MEFKFNEQLDASFLESIYGDDLGYANEMFEGFLSETRNEFEKIRNDYKNNDVKGMRQKLHKIKPTFGFVGLTGVQSQVEELIKVCDNSSTSSETNPLAGDLFAEIESSFLLIENESSRMKSFIV